MRILALFLPLLLLPLSTFSTAPAPNTTTTSQTPTIQPSLNSATLKKDPPAAITVAESNSDPLKSVLMVDIILAAAVIFTIFFVWIYVSITTNQKARVSSKKTVSVLARYNIFGFFLRRGRWHTKNERNFVAYAIAIITLSVLHGYNTLDRYISKDDLMIFIIGASVFAGLYVIWGVVYTLICYCYAKGYTELERTHKKLADNPPDSAHSNSFAVDVTCHS